MGIYRILFGGIAWSLKYISLNNKQFYTKYIVCIHSVFLVVLMQALTHFTLYML